MRILVAEDSVTMRKVLQMTFAGESAEVLAVETGEQALMQGRQFGPSIAFVDSSLPDIDGYELARAIKADPALSGTPVILMASQQNPYDEGRGSGAGVDAHILKPFDSQEAIDKARQLTGSGTVAAAPVTAPPMAAAASAMPSAQPAPPPLPTRGASIPIGAAASSRAPAPMASSMPAPASATSAPPSMAPLPLNGGNGAAAAMGDRLAALGLTQAQVEGVLKLSAEVVERVVWEVVPDLAEAMIREELHRLTGE